MIKIFGLFVGVLLSASIAIAQDKTVAPAKIQGIKAGMSMERLLKRFPEKEVRGFREVDGERRLTSPYPSAKRIQTTVSFYFKEDKLLRWSIGDREEATDQFIYEFIGRGLDLSYPKIYTAIRNVLIKVPEEVFLNITDRHRPVFILVNMTSGIARFANSIQFTMNDGEPPALSEGFYLIRVSDELEDSADPKAIEGIIAHEIAHRVLNHLSKRTLSCELEKEANWEILKWGFKEEYDKASEHFGAKDKTDSPCFEEKPKETELIDKKS